MIWVSFRTDRFGAVAEAKCPAPVVDRSLNHRHHVQHIVRDLQEVGQGREDRGRPPEITLAARRPSIVAAELAIGLPSTRHNPRSSSVVGARPPD